MTTEARSLPAQTLDLLRLRGGPQDYPHAPRRLPALLLLAVALDVAIGVMLGRGAHEPARSLLSAAVVLGLAWVALAIRRLGSRYVQTASALLACSIAFSLLSLPLAALAGAVPATADAIDTGQRMLALLTLGLFFWQLAVLAHVMRNAMESGFGFALCLVATWVVAYWALDHSLFGPPA